MRPINIRCLLSITILFCLYLTCYGELDFQFNDEEQATLADSQDDIKKTIGQKQQQHQQQPQQQQQQQPQQQQHNHHHYKNTYSKEVAQCPYTDDKLILSLVLKSNDWNDLIDNKKNRVITKLSKFFNVPKEYIKLDSITRSDMIEMAKWSIKRGPNKCNTNRKHGKIEFMIGCDQSSYFSIGNSILKQIGHQMKEGAIDDITGVDFGWWVIWKKKITNRVSRKTRQAEGSGLEEEDDYNYDDEDEYNFSDPVTDAPTTPTHAHRHHHGVPYKPDLKDSKIEKISIDTNTIDSIKKSNNNNNIKHKKNDFKPLQGVTIIDETTILTSSSSSSLSSSSLSSTIQPLDEEIVKSVSQLESVITKTIENTEKIKDLGTMGEPLPTDKSKKKSSSSKKSKIGTSTIYNIHMDKSKEDDFIIDDTNVGSTDRVPITSTSITTPSPPSFSTTFEPIELTTMLISTTTNPLTTTATTDINTINQRINNNNNNNNNSNNNNNIIINNLPSLRSSQLSSSSSSSLSSLFTTSTSTTTTTTTTTPNSTIIPTTETPLPSPPSQPPNQKLVYLDQTTQFSTVITTTKNDETTVEPLTDDILVVTSTNNNQNVRITTPSTSSLTPTTFNSSSITTITTTSTTPSTIQPTTIITQSSFDLNNSHISTTVEYVTEPATITPSTIKSISVISGTSTFASSVKGEDENEGNTSETIKEDEISVETTSSRNDEINTMIQESSTTTTTTTQQSTTEYVEPEPINSPPTIKLRLPKQPVTAGKPFSLIVPVETFYDNEDETNLRLELFDKNGHELKSTSWVQFNPETREIYGLPLEDAVSKWQYKLTATDSGNETVSEILDISVQQHKGHRSFNHEISLGVKLNKKFLRNIDWQIRLVKGIADTLRDDSLFSIVVREIRQNQQDPYYATFIFTNESLPKDQCPEEKLDELVARLDREKLNESVMPELSIKSVTGQPIGSCKKINVIKSSKPTPSMTKNHPPIPRNQVDRVNATVGHLLVFKVPHDTFYDPEDTTDLKLSLLNSDRSELNPRNWLQFDSKNQEFYGIPLSGDVGSQEYFLVAEDHEGLSAIDALVVVVNPTPRRDYNVFFKAFLGMRHELFNANMQRKFVERISLLFGDQTPNYIQIRSIVPHHDTDGTIVQFFNTTLHRNHRNRCPEEEIEMVRNVWFSQETNLRDRVKKSIGTEFELNNLQMLPLASCYSANGDIHQSRIPTKTDDNNTSSFKDDYMLTFVVPAIIILAMILLALIIACVLHRRRLTGKMELGDEEERKSFRSKGIPVIFQDELDEKPEIGNKSPIILKDEKPPLLPPSYNNSTNIDGDNDCDEYVPPPAVVIGGREIRGKSPVTPSYRKPPPYVSP